MPITLQELRELGCPGDDVALLAAVTWLAEQDIDCLTELGGCMNMDSLQGRLCFNSDICVLPFCCYCID